MKRKVIFALFFSIAFFLTLLFTIGDYGPSWDETIHFRRGQAYLHYFLTGNTNYVDLPESDLQGTGGNPKNVLKPRRSYYQNDIHNASFFLKNDVGHPPLNGELAALSNYIFYQKLGVAGDVESHHLFNILSSSILVFVVAFFSYSYFGAIPSIVSTLALITYPLFWSESHFNVKDPPEAAFFAATIWAFYESVVKKSTLWLWISIFFFFLAFGTKFNAVFIPVILILYYLLINFHKLTPKKLKNGLRKFPRSYLISLALSPVVVLSALIIFWPFLQQNFPINLLKIFGYYKSIGTGARYQPDNFFISGFNTFPLRWIIYTTPPLVLVLFFAGIIYITKNLKNKNRKNVSILWIIWLVVPIFRISVPGAAVYGGIRQALEFLPALCLISGLGAVWLTKLLKKHATLIGGLIILMFIWPGIVLVKLHPNQNVYFNHLIGGLDGASKKNFPSWGNSLGNAYLQGIEWLNANAENGSKIALIQGTPSNAPVIYFRKDLDYLVNGNVDSRETHFSGIKRKGEYLMELTYNDTGRDFFYVWEYISNFLEPVYELKVDGVPILKIWKNDLEHTKPEFKLSQKNIFPDQLFVNKNKIVIEFYTEVLLSKVDLEFNNNQPCDISGTVESKNKRGEWVREKDGFPQYQISRTLNTREKGLSYFFAGRRTRGVRIIFEDENKCEIFSSPQILVTVLK